MRADVFDALTDSPKIIVSRRRGVGAALAAMAALCISPAFDDVDAGKRARRRRRKRRRRERVCLSVCDGRCAECQEICETSCESGCPRCYYRPGAGPFCGTFTVTHKCGFCASNLDCPPEHPFCFTGFTDRSGGMTQRFTVCGDYPTGICTDFAGCS